MGGGGILRSKKKAEIPPSTHATRPPPPWSQNGEKQFRPTEGEKSQTHKENEFPNLEKWTPAHHHQSLRNQKITFYWKISFKTSIFSRGYFRRPYWTRPIRMPSTVLGAACHRAHPPPLQKAGFSHIGQVQREDQLPKAFPEPAPRDEFPEEVVLRTPKFEFHLFPSIRSKIIKYAPKNFLATCEGIHHDFWPILPIQQEFWRLY